MDTFLRVDGGRSEDKTMKDDETVDNTELGNTSARRRAERATNSSVSRSEVALLEFKQTGSQKRISVQPATSRPKYDLKEKKRQTRKHTKDMI